MYQESTYKAPTAVVIRVRAARTLCASPTAGNTEGIGAGNEYNDSNFN